MKSLHDGMKQMTNVLKQTHLKDAHIVLLTNFSRTVLVWCGFVLYLSGRYLCGVGLFCTICTVFKSIHIQLEPHSTFFTTKTGRKLYCVPIIADHKWVCFVLLKLFLYQPHPLSHIVLLNGFFQDGIGVVWVCFVPFRTVFVWCGFVLYHCGLVSCFFVFVVYNLKHTGHFSHQK